MTNNSNYRSVPKKNRQNPNKTVQLNNQIATGENTENPPDYLPFSVYSNLEQLQQKAQEDTIHPVRSSLPEHQGQPSQRPRKRHSRPLNLTGEVNLGTKMFTRREKKQRRKPVNTPEETVTNAGRHHHHIIPNEIETTQASVSTTTSTTTTTEEPEEMPVLVMTQTPVDKSSVLEEKKKLDEKALRRERLKQKLALLTPEERQAFLLMKQQRAEAKKRSLNLTD